MEVNEDHIIHEKVRSLDPSYPQLSWGEEELWQAVNSKLNKSHRPWRWGYMAAAVTLVALLLARVFIAESPGVTYEVSKEEDYNIPAMDPGEHLNSEAMEFIQSACLKELDICKTPEFIELKEQLDEVEKEIAELEAMIGKYGPGPAFISSKMKIENFRSEIMFQLVQVIMS